MSKKSAVIEVNIHAQSESIFHFEFLGDSEDGEAVKDEAWAALRSGSTLAGIAVANHEYTDDFAIGMPMECSVVSGSSDDYRPSIKPPSRRKLYRKISRIMGELEWMGRDGRLFTAWGAKELIGTARLVLRIRTFSSPPKSERRMNRLLAKLEAAIKEWEALV
jgi:hypothetical protein